MRRFLLPATVVSLIAAVVVGAWSPMQLRKPAAVIEPAPIARQAFDGTQPITFRVNGSGELSGWLKDELDFILPRAPNLRFEHGAGTETFVLVLDIVEQPQASISLALLAPDRFVERRAQIAVTSQSRFDVISTLMTELPKFLGRSQDWRSLPGTDDRNAYDTVARVRSALRAGNVAAGERVAFAGQLERITRQHPKYVRAWCTLSQAYLAIESEDAASLERLAIKAADRAMKLDPQASDAHAVRGWVQHRNSQWLAAYDDLTEALRLQPDMPLALEGLACLLADAGLSSEALKVAERARKVAPANTSVQECWAFAQVAMNQPLDAAESFEVARLLGAMQLFAGQAEQGQKTLADAARRENIPTSWLGATAAAVRDRSRTAEALRELTAAESESQIDPTTEMLAGLALKRRDFVLNRAQRLQRAEEFVPLRVLWLPQAANLRQHTLFARVITAAELPAFWQTHGLPDVCQHEPKLPICVK